MLVAVVAILIALILRKLYLAWYGRNPLDVLPGPPGLPVLGNIVLMFSMKPDNMINILSKYTKDYGDRYIFKIFKKRVLHLSNPDDIEILLTSRNISKSSSRLPYHFIQPWLGTGLLLNTGGSWARRRKMMTPSFNFNLMNFAIVMEEKSKDLVAKLKEINGAEVDVFPMISDLTLFIICETAMGTQLDSDKSSHTIEYKNAIQNIGHVVMERLTKVWLYSDIIFNIYGGKLFNKYLNTVHSFADAVILDKKKKKEERDKGLTEVLSEDGSKRKLALLDLLLESESKGHIDLTGIRDEVNTFMFAGHDTTAMALTFGFMLLAEHPDVQDRIYEEIAEILGTSDKIPTITDFAQMKYLDAVIKETMRLYPSAPIIGREIEQDFMMGNILVKKGTDVSVHIYDLHHRADIYPQPEEFKPERFLDGEMRHRFAYLPFSAGPRNCIGQKFAMQEMKLVITEVCRNFRLEPRVKGFRPLLKSDIILRPAEPIYVKFIPRK